MLREESMHVRDVMHDDDRYKSAESNFPVLDPVVLDFVRTNKIGGSEKFECRIVFPKVLPAFCSLVHSPIMRG